MQELAAVTGIPRVTISRVINQHPHVSERMRRRVQEAIARHGYESNIMARSLVMRRNNLLAFIVPDIRISFYSEMIDRVEREALGQGLDLLPFNSFFNAERERHLLTLVRRLQADTLIIVPITAHGELVNGAELAGFRKRVLFFDRFVSPQGGSVMMDNAAAGRLAAEHLIALGHRRLAMLESSEDPRNVCVRDRREGFARAVRRHGLPFNRARRLRLDWPEQSSGFEYGHALVKTCRPQLRSLGITALFAHSDHIALGAMRALAEDGIRVPGELSLVGCDDLDFSAYSNPPLTTIRQPVEEMARALVRAVNTREGDTRVEIAPQLVERDSCAAPRANALRGIASKKITKQTPSEIPQGSQARRRSIGDPECEPMTTVTTTQPSKDL